MGMGKWLTLVIGLITVPAAVLAEEACVAGGQWLDPATGRRLADDDLIGRMAARPMVLLGEVHDNAEHHRWQLHTLSALHGRNPNMVLGFEAFPRSVQAHLDRWTRGNMDEQAFLKASRWDQVWRFDPALYMPLFHFARIHRIPMVALNVDQALIGRVREDGWQAVPGDAREGVSDPAPPSEAYVEYLAQSYANHPSATGKTPERDDPKFKRFVAVQLTWDRAMAERLAGVRLGGGKPLVVGIVGLGHLVYGYGISHQLEDLGISDSAVLLPWDTDLECTGLVKGAPVADAVFGMDRDTPAPPGPRLGVVIDGLRIQRVILGSVAEAAGLATDDRILEAAGRALENAGDLIAIVRRQAPGSWLPIKVERGAETLEIVAKFPPRGDRN
jgi:uncharacterized iron-regulated protein